MHILHAIAVAELPATEVWLVGGSLVIPSNDSQG
jgi:hypothetical protein